MSIGGIVVGLACAIYLALDAPKRGKSPTLWAILGFLFGFLPLGIYMCKTNRVGLGVLYIVLFSLGIIIAFVAGVFAALAGH